MSWCPVFEFRGKNTNAGYDNATFGLPPPNETYPLLATPTTDLMVQTPSPPLSPWERLP